MIELKSINPEVVSVENGKLRALQLGQARVDVRIEDVIVTCFVNVTEINDEKHDIYLAGVGFPNKAMYVKNGITFELPSGNKDSYATCLDAQGNDVYVGGSVGNDGVYWKNDDLHIISVGENWITDIAVSGNDVYVIGNTKGEINARVATVWKNGVKKQFESTFFSEASAVEIDNNNVYVAGFLTEISFPNIAARAVYWKNDEAVILTPNTQGQAKDLKISNQNIYVCGFQLENEIQVAMYWKNGVAVKLSDGKVNSVATNIDVDGDDVYITGYEEITKIISIPILWKNGMKQIISNAQKHGNDFPLAASNGDLYLICHLFYEKNFYLKNSEPITLFQYPFLRIEDINLVKKQK